MNTACDQLLFRAELPHGGLPEEFAILLLSKPIGKRRRQSARTAPIRAQVTDTGFDHFPVSCCVLDSAHPVAGLAVVCRQSAALELAKTFEQPKIHWVHRGQVRLVPCDGDEPSNLFPWSKVTDPPEAARPRFHFRGPFALLERPATAFLCSTRCPAAKVTEAYEWARGQCDEGNTVISGFHTPVEKDVLAILARRGARILWAPARDLPKTIPEVMKTPWNEKRLVVLSPFPYTAKSRARRSSCSQRNRFVLAFAKDRYIPHVSPGSSLHGDLAMLNL